MRIDRRDIVKTVIASSIALLFGWFLRDFFGDRSIEGVEKIYYTDVIIPVLLSSFLGVFAGGIGVLRNRNSSVEIDLNQIFPYLFSAIGYVASHFVTSGISQPSDVGLVGVSFMVAFFVIGTVKNSILYLHNINVVEK